MNISQSQQNSSSTGMKDLTKKVFKRALPHLIAVTLFLVVAVVYCWPALNNKVLFQEDVLQWQGMSHNSFQYKDTHGHFPLWSNSMFSGMPAYQIAMDSQSVSIPGMFYGILTLFLAKPASFFFLACICFYFLAIVLRTNPYVGIIGALAYAYATYNPVIVAVGHDTKMQSIALMPAVIASLILICEKKYWVGMVLTALFTALIISFNHMQIVYYTMIVAAGMLLGYAIPWIRSGQGRRLGQTMAMVLGAAVIGILSNAVVLFTTFDSSRETVRGGSELVDEQGNMNSDGLSEHVAVDFSMYKTEPLVMLVPNMYGGSSDQALLSPERSKAVKVMEKMPPDLAAQIGQDGPRYYWGGVGELFSGPPYIGAIVVLLALIGFFVLDGRHKWWILGTCIVTIAMSWGGYFQPLSRFLLKYLPMYNKFRAPSMIIVAPSLMLCMLATLSLQRILTAENRTALWTRYKWSLLPVAGLFLLLTGLYFRSDYTSTWEQGLIKKAAARGSDAVASMEAFANALRLDRQVLFAESLLRALLLVSAAAVIIALYIRKKLKPAVLLGVVGGLIFIDLMTTDIIYLNESNYNVKEDYQQNFVASPADKAIMADKGYFRVFDLRDSISEALSYGAMTAYFHHSIGGYHAAKLKIYDDLITHQLYNYPHSASIVDMLNTRYIIHALPGGKDTALLNTSSLGPAWFVHTLRYEPTAKEVMGALTNFHPADTAVLFSEDSSRLAALAPSDSTGIIQLIKNDNDEVSYLSESKGRQFAVFSEVYYKRGWRAWIDDQETPIVRTNYVLRGLVVPPGRHIIRFFFHPSSYYLGRQIQWMASIIFLLMIAGTIIVSLQEKRYLWSNLRRRPALRPAA
jgi:hypothetical protein